jgi:hypothetical protein
MPKLPDAQNTPLRREAEVVKTLPEASQSPRLSHDFSRHFEGYELGLVTVGMVLTFALLALPRASVPMTLPLPAVDRAEAQRSASEERELAARTEAEGLPYEVRAVGEAIRRLGRASAQGEDASHDQDDLRTRVKVVFDEHQAPRLLRLRAVQTQYFLAALRQFEHDGKANAEIDELGGDFLTHARKSGWLDDAGKLLPDEATLRVLFRLRWADLIGKAGVFPFSPSLNEWRIYYRFLLRHPAANHGEVAAPASEEDAQRLRLATGLGRKDPDYPTEMAQGYLLYRLGDAEGAAVAYRRQLAKHQGGRYALLAQNYLIYMLQGAGSE